MSPLTATNSLPPVRDMHGHTVWRVRVGQGEMTCTGCGEVVMGDCCTRCGTDDEGNRVADGERPPLVPTVSYLRDGEWERV